MREVFIVLGIMTAIILCVIVRKIITGRLHSKVSFELQIQNDFPTFSQKRINSKVEEQLRHVFKAISQNDETVADVDAQLKDKVKLIVQNNLKQGIKECYSDIRFYGTKIIGYTKEENYSYVTLQSDVGYKFYKESDGELTEGDKVKQTRAKYTVETVFKRETQKYIRHNSYSLPTVWHGNR